GVLTRPTSRAHAARVRGTNPPKRKSPCHPGELDFRRATTAALSSDRHRRSVQSVASQLRLSPLASRPFSPPQPLHPSPALVLQPPRPIRSLLQTLDALQVQLPRLLPLPRDREHVRQPLHRFRHLRVL